MLKVDLGGLERRQTLRVEGRVEADDDFFEGFEFTFQEPLNVVLNAAWAGSGELVVRGGVVGAVFQDCRRCLDPVEQRIDLDISLLFAPSDLLEEDDGETYRLELGVREIDLGPYVREEVALAIPSFAECGVDCRGLCAGCGENLNESECKCSAEGTDPRWDALRALENKRVRSMAVPKKRTSKQRKRKRRTHYKAEPVVTNTCSRCGDPKIPHRVCPSCGYYGGEQVLDLDLD